MRGLGSRNLASNTLRADARLASARASFCGGRGGALARGAGSGRGSAGAGLRAPAGLSRKSSARISSFGGRRLAAQLLGLARWTIFARASLRLLFGLLGLLEGLE